MKQLRILTLNLWAQHGPWLARAAAIRAGLVAELPDVVALQEVLGFADGLTQLDELCGELPIGLYPDSAYAPACQLGEGRTFGNGLLSRHPILEYKTITLPNPYQREARALLAVLVDLPGGRQLPVFVTHLDWQLDGSYARCQQVRFIADQIDTWVAAARRRPGADVLPAVLAGDFNAEPESDEVRFLTGHHALGGVGEVLPRGAFFMDCYARAAAPEDRAAERAAERAAGADGASRGDGGATFARANPFAARAREPDRRIDYVFAGLPDAKGRGEPVRAWRCFREPYQGAGFLLRAATAADRAADPGGGVFASDHYGVAVDLTA